MSPRTKPWYERRWPFKQIRIAYYRTVESKLVKRIRSRLPVALDEFLGTAFVVAVHTTALWGALSMFGIVRFTVGHWFGTAAFYFVLEEVRHDLYRNSLALGGRAMRDEPKLNLSKRRKGGKR